MASAARVAARLFSAGERSCEVGNVSKR
jgi:hypothetical protein